MAFLGRTAILLITTILRLGLAERNNDLYSVNQNDCSTTDSFEAHQSLNISESDLEEILTEETRDNLNMSHLKTINIPKDRENQPKLNFPKENPGERYKMTSLHLDKGFFVFDFLRSFLSFIQPNNFPIDLLTDALENRITASRLISQSMHVEAGLIALAGVSCLLACVIPGMVLWLVCKPTRDDYEPSQHPGVLTFLLSLCIFLLGSSMVTMMVCNEEVADAMDKIPMVMETALNDLGGYHTETTTQLRKTLTRSLDVASEAILADLDNVEELLGKPVQSDLAAETGIDSALEILLEVANATQELSSKMETLLKEGERARDFAKELSLEAGDLRRELDTVARSCPTPDRPLCATLDPSGLHLALHFERLLHDDRLVRLRGSSRDNFTETTRQIRGEYLYVPHHVARVTLDARNSIRHEINAARSKVYDEGRNLESRSSGLKEHLQEMRKVTHDFVPHLATFERNRWLICIGTVLCVFVVFLLLLAAVFCRCRSSEDKVRPTLLCAVLASCITSVALWAVVLTALALSSHAEMLLCRPLHDPEYQTMEAVLETPFFYGRHLSVPLKDLFDKCQENEAAYPAFQLDNSMKLEQLTAHWTWSGLARAMTKVKVDLKGLRISTPNLQQRLQSLLYASGPNLTDHRIQIQGPILNKDLSALSDQLENVARQLKDRKFASNLGVIASSARDLLSRRIRPLMKLRDELVYRLTTLELQLQPLQRQVNQSIYHLKSIQHYIDNEGENIVQLKTKSYVDRLEGYLDQWRIHVLAQMNTEVARCRPLWDVLQGIKLLLCQHILGPLNGFWLATMLCALVMMISTPTAHALASIYRKDLGPKKDSGLLMNRTESPDTVVVMDRNTWQSPDTPPRDGW